MYIHLVLDLLVTEPTRLELAAPGVTGKRTAPPLV